MSEKSNKKNPILSQENIKPNTLTISTKHAPHLYNYPLYSIKGILLFITL
jgi:hypothetical protein